MSQRSLKVGPVDTPDSCPMAQASIYGAWMTERLFHANHPTWHVFEKFIAGVCAANGAAKRGFHM